MSKCCHDRVLRVWPSACLCQKLSIKWPATKSPASGNTSLAGRRSPQVDKAVGGATKRPASANTSLAERRSPEVDEAVAGQRRGRLAQTHRYPSGGASSLRGSRMATKKLANANMSLVERRSPQVDEAVNGAMNRPASGTTSLAEQRSP